MVYYIQRHLVNFYGNVAMYIHPQKWMCPWVFVHQFHLCLVSPDPETTPETHTVGPPTYLMR